MSARKETIWVIASASISASSMLVVFILLAQFTSPEVIGQLSIINIVLGLSLLIQDMGMSSYIIHRQLLNSTQRSTLYFVNVGLGIITFLIVLLVSYPIGAFYDSEEIKNGLIIVSFNFILISLSAQYEASFIKTLKSQIVSRIEIFSRISLLILSAFFIVICSLGLNGYLIALLVSNLIRYITYLLVSPNEFHPKLLFNKEIIKPALAFGGFQMGSQIINQFRTQADQLIIGKIVGLELLGVYTVAKELVLKPLRLTNPITARVVKPRFAKIQDNKLALSDLFKRACLFIMSFNLAVFIIVAIAFYFILPVFFGKEYGASVSIFTILLLIGILRPIGGLLGAISQAKGNSKLEFKWNIIAGVVATVALLTAIPFETLYSFAVAATVSQAILTCYSLSFFSKNLTQLNVKPIQLSILIYSILHFGVIYILFSITEFFNVV